MLITNHINKKYKLDPTKTQTETFDFWFRRCKVLYNVALEEKIEYYRKTNKYFLIAI
jgi:hypothetical protein